MKDHESLRKWIELANDFGKTKTPFLFILDFELKKPKIYALDNIPENISYKVNTRKNYNIKAKSTRKIVLHKSPILFSEYKMKFDKVMEEILYGNSFLLNLTIKTKIESNFTLKEIFTAAHAKYKLFFDNEFCVFSPESFIKIEDNYIKTFPMKGTINASIEDAKYMLLNDKKEMAEHATIVDLLRNDLSQVAKSVHVKKYRYIDKINTTDTSLYQASSEIIGKLPDNYHTSLGDLLISLLPAGSVSGAPKIKTVEIIKEAEKEDRGYYTGIFGIFDGENLDSGVMIRFIENINGQLYYRSGGGITYQSKAESEFLECIDKIYVPIS